MSKKPALGRGLNALINPSSDASAAPRRAHPPRRVADEPEVVGYMAGNIALLSIAAIEANPDQPRKDFDPEALNELATSIRELGIIQPITVRKVRANKYQIISGERRFRASQLAGLDAVPAYIREADDQALLEMALVENIQRENLHAIEVAVSLRRLLDECNLTHDQLADRIGKSRSSITNFIRLLHLPEPMQLAVSAGELSMGHARALVGITDANKQLALFNRILEQGLSVRQAEQFAREASASALPKAGKPLLSFDEQKVDLDLQRRFGKAASLKPKGNGAGKIELVYKDAGELDRILQMMNL